MEEDEFLFLARNSASRYQPPNAFHSLLGLIPHTHTVTPTDKLQADLTSSVEMMTIGSFTVSILTNILFYVL
jgi:hypothetical protein